MNYKSIITSIAAFSMACAANGQAIQHPLSLVWYKVNETLTYQVSGCTPGSEIAYYSEVSGGKVLKTAVADANGCNILSADKDFKPAFALNAKNPGVRGAKGNGTVGFLRDMEFELDNILLNSGGGNVILEWNAAVPQADAYHFEILKSVNGHQFETLGSVPVSSASMSAYSFNDNSSGSDATYELRITNNRDVTYTSQPMKVDGAETISVYPTVATDAINISLSGNDASGDYRVVDYKGQTVLSGKLHDVKTSLAVDALSPGNYLVQVTTRNSTRSAKIVKQ